ncbi:uncharacterized protein Bfra_001748 [Botrytis fragariae]|uniref:Uncharacterized protein n=1 Tax=Botrytis fragariae TaxID=1964551 RepID=A0A8H6EM52_9HELO|nr:uncharacterized protein Bfra_001748 [Botrytis fragariae]KAF5877381.1 hypothetical protein Bfra_001748 [Botrytis fragariae]
MAVGYEMENRGSQKTSQNETETLPYNPHQKAHTSEHQAPVFATTIGKSSRLSDEDNSKATPTSPSRTSSTAK